MSELVWKTIGPARPQGIAVPPVSMSLNGYTLTYDPSSGRVLYVCGPGYGGTGETWSFDGTQWTKLVERVIQFGDGGMYQGGYDSARQGVMLWRKGNGIVWEPKDEGEGEDGEDGEEEAAEEQEEPVKRTVPMGMLLTADSAKPLRTTGNMDFGNVRASGSPAMLLAFDPLRSVWVCLTRVGVWELGLDNAWVERTRSIEGVPPKWTDEGFGSGYDAARKSVVFWVFDHSDDIYCFFAWDGTTLTPLPGIPRTMAPDAEADDDPESQQPNQLIATHPQHGLVCFQHEKGALTLPPGSASWIKLDGLPQGPPLMKNAQMVWSPTLDAFVSGPGEHEGSSDAQRLFYLTGATCLQMGVRAEKSPIDEASYSTSRHAVWRGRWYAVSKSCLEMWGWDDAQGWLPVVTEEQSKEGTEWGWSDVTLVATDSALLAVRGDGAVYAYDGTAWSDRGVEVPPSFTKREQFTLAAQPDGTLVLWGGRIDSRRLNDTFILSGGKWRAAANLSRVPTDFANIKKEIFVDFDACWDSKLGAVVRFGYDDVAILMSEIWQPFKVSGYDSNLIGPRDRAHIPCHDPRTGQTLLIDLEELRVGRFDIGGCTELAKVAPAPLLKTEVEEPVTWKSLHETCAFDAENLRLLGQDKEDRWGTFALDLAPAFAAAQALGMRSIPSPVPPPAPGAVLYRVTDAGAQSWGYRVLGSQLEISVGPLAAPRTETSDLGSAEAALAEATRQEAARVADGYRHALELDGDALRSMACAWSQEIDVLAAEGGDDEEDEDEDADEDEEEEDGDGEEQEDKAPPVIAGRLGGLPNGLAVERWPRCRDEHMGFLLQLETGDLVPGYAAVALFCVTSGTATEDDEDEQDQNEAVFLTAAELASPETPAPEGVPVMPPRPIAIQAKLGEIDEARMAPLVERDLALGAALDALLGSGSGLQAGSTFSKRGGLPSWVQSAVREPTGYIMQLDFDRIRLDESWEEAGLAGCVMVFWNGEGNRPSMFWQYT